jgi:hypothetical protein
MRFYEISGGLRIPISEEEQSVLDIISDEGIQKSKLDERQQEVARLMVTRGLLLRSRDSDGNIVLRCNSMEDIWRI